MIVIINLSSPLRIQFGANNPKFNFLSQLSTIVCRWRMCTMKNDSNREVIYWYVVIYLYFNYFVLVHSLFWHLLDLTEILIISVSDKYMYCYCMGSVERDFESNFVFRHRMDPHCSFASSARNSTNVILRTYHFHYVILYTVLFTNSLMHKGMVINL